MKNEWFNFHFNLVLGIGRTFTIKTKFIYVHSFIHQPKKTRITHRARPLEVNLLVNIKKDTFTTLNKHFSGVYNVQILSATRHILL